MTAADLVRKYETLLRLRAELVAPLTAEQRQSLRALAAEFPSALRELETFDEAELYRRCARAAAGTDPWVARMCAYHQRMRDELARRRAGERERAPDGRLQKRVMQSIADEAGLPLDELWESLLPLRGRRRDYRRS